jgi:hypothetical protein
MDPRVRDVIEGAMGAVANDFKSIEPLIEGRMNSLLESCFAKNENNSDRFADCFLEKNKKIEDIMKPVEYKMMFFSKKANLCLQKKSILECT